MYQFNIPDLAAMSDDEVKLWVESLTTDIVYKHLTPITEAIMERLGPDARVSTSSFQTPKIVHLIENSA